MNQISICNDRFEYPQTWSENAAYIAGSKFARVIDGHKERSVEAICERVARTVFPVEDKKQMAFRNGLLLQRFAPNSPVFFNLGVPALRNPILSACFVLSVDDTMESIIDLWVTSANVFRAGAGVGVDLSNLRERGAPIRGEVGISSGPTPLVSDVVDSIAKAIKSGGASRRSAVLMAIRDNHPDMPRFIQDKVATEQLMRMLSEKGVDVSLNADIWELIASQQANRSVIISDSFIEAVQGDQEWAFVSPYTGQVTNRVPARNVFQQIATAAWECGDPGVLFHDTINRMNTLPQVGVINNSNVCLGGDTRFVTEYGYLTIRELSRMGFVKVWTPGGWRVAQVWSNGVKSVVEVTLSNGINVTCTPDHKIKVGDEWCQAEELTTQSIQVVAGPGFWNGSENTSIPLDDLVRLGFIQGDGSPQQDCAAISVNLGEKDVDVALLFNQYTQHSSRTCYVPAHDYLVEQAGLLGLSRANLPERNLPSNLWCLSSIQVGAFLKGLFSANGYVIEDKYRVGLRTTNKRLSRDLQSLLLALGYHPYITNAKEQHIKWPNGAFTSKPSYVVNLPGYDLAKYAEEIGFVQKFKTEALVKAVNERRPTARRNAPFVKSRLPVGEQEVFNFTVDDPAHSGWVNGLVVANCGEVLLPRNFACNLLSLNLLKYWDNHRKTFYFDLLWQDVDLCVEAMDRLVDLSAYPNEKIAANAAKYRPLGLGICNLGGLLQVMNLPYDSVEGRLVASALMGIITGYGYEASILSAAEHGTYCVDDLNQGPVWDVVEKHYDSVLDVTGRLNTYDDELMRNLRGQLFIWDAVRADLRRGQYPRNATITSLPPTGTVSIWMDAATTGCEPAFSLIYEKELVHDKKKLIVPLSTVPTALSNLGYDTEYLIPKMTKNGTLKGLIADDDLPIFATAVDMYGNVIPPSAHVDMVAALQPFVSQGISKTVNLPYTATVQDVKWIIKRAYQTGCKSITVYRDGSKVTQPHQAKTVMLCPNCGEPLQPNGSCFLCPKCGDVGACGII